MAKEEIDVRSLLKDIRDDPKYKQFKKIVTVAQSRLNIEKDASEAKTLHAGRTSRTLYGDKQYSVKAIINASATDLSARARLVELRVNARRHASYVEEAVKNMTRHLTTEYAADFRHFRNESQRKGVMEKSMRTAMQLLSEVDDLVEMIDTFIKDIDQASHSLRHVMDGLKLLDGTKSGRVI